MSTGSQCEVCSFDNATACKSARREMQECEVCSRTICRDCLRGMAEDVGLSCGDDSAPLFKCEATDTWQCAECYEASDKN